MSPIGWRRLELGSTEQRISGSLDYNLYLTFASSALMSGPCAKQHGKHIQAPACLPGAASPTDCHSEAHEGNVVLPECFIGQCLYGVIVVRLLGQSRIPGLFASLSQQVESTTQKRLLLKQNHQI
jgi:hypothetical protein